MASETACGLDPEGARAVRRWKLGHHVFHLQLVVMSSLLDEAVAAVRDEAWPVLTEALGRVADLYDAATASMKYAADFDPRLYESLIRPSMSPPYLRPGFSGLLNQDHDLMLQRVRALRAELDRLLQREDAPAGIALAAERLWTAQGRNRRHHMLVCERFVPGGRSLLKEFFDQRRAGKPAVLAVHE